MWICTQAVLIEAHADHTLRPSFYLHKRSLEPALGSILWAVVVILVVLWLVGFIVLHVSSGLIHLLLIVALIVLLYNLFTGSRARRL